MTKFVHFLILIAAVSVIGDKEITCDHKPFHTYEQKCFQSGDHLDNLNTCVYLEMGFVNAQGKFSPEKLKDILKPHTVRQEALDKYMSHIKTCTDSVKLATSAQLAVGEFNRCHFPSDIEDTLREALCEYDETDYGTIENVPATGNFLV